MIESKISPVDTGMPSAGVLRAGGAWPEAAPCACPDSSSSCDASPWAALGKDPRRPLRESLPPPDTDPKETVPLIGA
jgi:hypothetical protein